MILIRAASSPVGCEKCSSTGISLVPSYASAYLHDVTAEKARRVYGALGLVILDSAGRMQRRFATLWPDASLAMEAAMASNK